MNIQFEQPEYKAMMFYEDIARIFWVVPTTILFFQDFWRGYIQFPGLEKA